MTADPVPSVLPVPQLAPSTELPEALEVINCSGVGYAAVVESGHCVGLVAAANLVAAEPPADPTVPLTVGELCLRPAPTVQTRAGTVPRLSSEQRGRAVVALNGVRVVGVIPPHETARPRARTGA